ncbi:hypothetical protein E3O42_11205 [Cryobacterium adonitolivorans]|uniref:Uncharacterized protein n=1 Tax=Cryobacterium adonitolivorans TaxID=1259189 RepID=A0A4R8W5G8_9MICO|nr:hypothetical protein [Cryobacterium adonitolivorans]TFC01038.1 hypothetical protein E3O42_11205 [Cryobacterium adonitolivorans]
MKNSRANQSSPRAPPAAFTGFDVQLHGEHWREGTGDHAIEDLNPWTEEPILRIRSASLEA